MGGLVGSIPLLAGDLMGHEAVCDKVKLALSFVGGSSKRKGGATAAEDGDVKGSGKKITKVDGPGDEARQGPGLSMV